MCKLWEVLEYVLKVSFRCLGCVLKVSRGIKLGQIFQKFFEPKIYLDPNFSWTQIFQNNNFLDLHFLVQNLFWTKIFFRPKNSLTEFSNIV